ncbi:MAG: two component transcriptional regulator, LuxR family [Thermoleophilia bacterium]|nr:two component transcriptional regulator, LuxR family [Thermoleophilia bacterium]
MNASHSPTTDIACAAINIVVVDDFPIVRTALAQALEQDPRLSVVGSYGDARELLDALVMVRPDVIVLDLHLPDLHGPELVARVRQLHPRPRILACTASERAATVLATLGAGANGYAVKRQSATEIAQAVVAVHQGDTFLAPQVTAVALGPGNAAQGDCDDARHGLKPAEIEILRHVLSGATDEDIARALYVSTRTVQNRLAHIRRVASVSRRAELARWALENHIV